MTQQYKRGMGRESPELQEVTRRSMNVLSV